MIGGSVNNPQSYFEFVSRIYILFLYYFTLPFLNISCVCILFWNVTLHSLGYLTNRDFYFERLLDGSAQSPLMQGDREYRDRARRRRRRITELN